MKAIIVIIIFGVFVAVHVFPPMSLDQVACLEDYSHNVTSEFRDYFEANP